MQVHPHKLGTAISLSTTLCANWHCHVDPQTFDTYAIIYFISFSFFLAPSVLQFMYERAYIVNTIYYSVKLIIKLTLYALVVRFSLSGTSRPNPN